jgi:hypothetical protein
MPESPRNLQKLNVQYLDAIRTALSTGLHRLVIRTRKATGSLWTGKVAVEETVITVELSDARH